jgi:twitching motility protein PilT
MEYTPKSLIPFGIDMRASDIHLNVGSTPTLRIDGMISPIQGPSLDADDVRSFVDEIVPQKLKEELRTNGEIDFALSIKTEGEARHFRLRVNVFSSRGDYGVVLRIINNEIVPLDAIGFPDLKVIHELISMPRGLILITGPCGSGKSTTLASMIDWINDSRKAHIVTIEDPIEYVHTHKKCIVSQREVGPDTPSFDRAIVGAMRQDPNVILVGEMRDLPTVLAAVSAAETGHLVMSTLHTTGAARTVDRIVDIFPDSGKELVRTQLASNLVAVISQVLCRRATGSGRVAAFEVMVRTDSIANLIREKKTFRIHSEIEVGHGAGMISLDKHLAQLFNKNVIAREEAIAKAQFPDLMVEKLKKGTVELKPHQPPKAPVEKKGWF